MFMIISSGGPSVNVFFTGLCCSDTCAFRNGFNEPQPYMGCAVAQGLSCETSLSMLPEIMHPMKEVGECCMGNGRMMHED